MREPFDRGSKWLYQHYGNAFILLAGIRRPVRSWRALAAEVVQPKQIPDGLLEVQFADQEEPAYFLAEIATYPEARVEEQMVRDAFAVFLDRRRLPELITLVLQPKGAYRIPGSVHLASLLGLTEVRMTWRVIELWNIPAADLLATKEMGLLPLVPLAQISGPPQPVLDECRRRIEEQAQETEKENLLAVTQVLMRLRYNDQSLFALFGGRQAMIESPLIQELLDETEQKYILLVLTARFGPLPEDVVAAIKSITTEARLEKLLQLAAICPDLEAFRKQFFSTDAKP